MSNEVQIYLNECSYIPGQILEGRVECNYSSNQNIGGLTVKFSGKCTTSWTQSELYYDNVFKKHRIRFVSCSGEEIYFKEESSLVGSTMLLAGKQVYDFSYKLPDILPSSYSEPNNWGCIQYKVEAIVDGEFNTEAATVFTVLSSLDLNYVPRIKEPVDISLDEVLCSCWCSNNDVLTFKFSLPSTGYIPGQDVPIGACIENLTNTNVEAVKFNISEKTEFKTTCPRASFKYNKEILAATASGAVGAHGNKSWTTVLNIPGDRYFPNLVNCNLIQITYELKAEVVLPMPHTNLSTVVPITIGHVQFVGAQLNLVLGPPQERVPNYDGILELGPPQETVPNYESVLSSAPPPGTDQCQTVVGRVECNYSSIQNIKGITVKFSGKCVTAWSDSETYYNDYTNESQSRQVLYSGVEVYFKEKINLAGSISLLSGRQVYDISYKLPDVLPSSYKGPHNWGSVQYTVKAVVDRGWKLNNKAVAAFTVTSPLDLNYVPGIREPVHISVDKVLCSWRCTRKDALMFKFSLPSTGFVPGQDVPIGVSIQNLTNTSVEAVKFEIKQEAQFMAKTPCTSYKHKNEIVASGLSGGVGAHGEKSFTTLLNIPRDRYFPNLVNCGLIRMNYELKAEVVLPMPHSNLKAEVPITIGHVQFSEGVVNGELGPPVTNYGSTLTPIPPSYSQAKY
ncbi:hypothetical protein FQR65_LT13332 [Abscondita terminalis]|nr:hypothetical protein FQR65_LT13332 [Abscondita terminalis]